MVQFCPKLGWTQSYSSFVNEMPQLVKAVTVKFALSNLNTRRKYSRLSISQAGAPAGIELTDYFMVGSEVLPKFGMATEVTLAWSDEFENALTLEMAIAYDTHDHSESSTECAHNEGHASISIVGFHMN